MARNDSDESTLKRKFEDFQISDKAASPKRRYTTDSESELPCDGHKRTKFVDNETFDTFNFLCGKCGKVAKDPQTLPCGHSYCKKYLQYLEQNSAVPHLVKCEVDDCESLGRPFNISEDVTNSKALERDINNLKVYCDNKEIGCKKTPQLKHLKKHINEVCEYGQVRCEKCIKYVLRKDYHVHYNQCTMEVCRYHKIGCEHVVSSTNPSSTLLDNHDGLHIAMAFHHLEVLKERTVLKPEDIRERLDMTENKIISLEEINKNLRDQDGMSKEQEQVKTLIKQVPEKHNAVKAQLEEFKDTTDKRMPRLAEKKYQQKRQAEYMEYTEEQHSKGSSETIKTISHLPMLHHVGSIIFRVSEFSKHRTAAIKGDIRRVHGPKFYASNFSYLLCPMIYPNGDGAGAGTHLSVFLAVCKGPYDALLKWPLLARISFHVLPQKPSADPVRYAFRSDIASPSYHRPANEMNPASGIPRTIPLEKFKPPSDYLIDDTLFIKFSIELLNNP